MRPVPLAGLIAVALSPHAHAQTVDGPQEVLVTAQRIAAPAASTPVAVSVLSGDDLREGGVTTPSDLAKRLPNVHLDGAADGLKITIRGVSNADATDKGDPSAAFLVDGIYIARPQDQNGLLLDVERIEVLRGPQGTLYGRNTTAGAINVITHAPTPRLEAAFGLGAGNYGSRQVDGMLNVPVSPALALRAAVAVDRHDAYLRGGRGQDRDSRAARVSASLALGPAATLLLRVEHATNDYNPDVFVADTNFYRDAAGGHPAWYGAPANERLTSRFVPRNAPAERGWAHNRTSGYGAQFTWSLGPATLYYLGAHRRFELDYLTNYIYRIVPTLTLGVRNAFGGEQEQDTHELRIAATRGPVSAQAGVYWFREQSRSTYVFRDLQVVGLPPYYVFPTDPVSARSRAAFGQATYRVTERLRATAGLRYTADGKSRVGATRFQQGPVFHPATDFQLPNAARIDTGQRTWRLGLDYDIAPATFVYATLATGYKAGGFNDGCLAGATTLGVPCPAAAAVPAASLFYQPETLKSTEAGLKTRFWQRRATLNAALFHYDYTNLQLSGSAVINGAPRFITANAGAASVRGLELDGAVQASADDRIHYGVTLLDAHYAVYAPDGVHSWAGRKLDRAPAHVIMAGYERRFRLAGHDVRAGLAARRSGTYRIAVPTKLVQYAVPPQTLVDATLAWQPHGAPWSLSAYGRNLGNRVAPVTVDSFGMAVPGAPRTFGVRAQTSY